EASRRCQDSKRRLACRGQPRTVGAEAHGLEQISVPFGEEFLAGGAVPHPHSPVETGRSQPFAVGAEAYAPDVIGVPTERKEFFAAGAVPNRHRPVVATAGRG